MKKKVLAFLIAMSMLVLAGCGAEEKVPVEQEKPAEKVEANLVEEQPEAQENSQEIQGVKLEDADFLDTEQKELLEKGYDRLHAFKISTGYFGHINENETDSSEMIDIEQDGEIYHKYDGVVYDGWDAFYTDMLSVFTEDFYNQINTMEIEVTNKSYPLYIEHDGDLYYHDGDRGTNITYLFDRYELAEQTEGEIRLTRISYFQDGEELKTVEEAEIGSSETSEIILKKTENGWRIDELTMPY